MTESNGCACTRPSWSSDMRGYLVVSEEAGQPEVQALSGRLRERAISAGVAVQALNSRTWAAVWGPNPPRLVQVGAWTLIGDVVNRNSPRFPAIPANDPYEYERKLLARFWGRFVGLRFASDRIAAILRDPSGATDCLTWSQEGLTVVASDAPEWFANALRPDWSLNISRIHELLSDSLRVSEALPFDGVSVVPPGALLALPARADPVPLWRPSVFAQRSLNESLPLPEAAAALRTAIDESVSGLSRLPGSLAAEVSGGLDSSIVASALKAAGADVRLWLNAVGSTPEANERDYVAALSRRLGFDPDYAAHAALPLTANLLEQAGDGVRPSLAGLDPAHDLDWAERMGHAGVDAVVTGKGGDSILLQSATGDVFTDLWRSRGWRAVGWPDLPRLAVSNEVSVWTLIRQARKRSGGNPIERALDFITPLDDRAESHPWLTDCEAFGPAKTLQIAGVADLVTRHGSSLLTRRIDVRHPLCAQPVVETALALPAWQLVHGGRDRGLARHAFADRLPSEIVKRRSKGDMTRIYGRMVLDNLTFLRSWLLEGRLATMGLIDLEKADRLLDRDTLMWRGGYGSIIVPAAIEGWVRRWERRLSTPGPRALR